MMAFKLERIQIKGVVAEFFAAFIFLFSAMAVGVNATRAKDTSGMVLCGLVVFLAALAVIRVFGDLSGAHFNPAVTFGAIVGGHIHPLVGGLYMAAQLLGGTAAVLFLMAMFPEGVDLAKTLVLKPADDATTMNALATEFILSFILIFVIYGTVMGVSSAPADPEAAATTDAEAKFNLKVSNAPMAIAAAIGYLGCLGGSSSGGCYNPARAMGPAFLAFDFSNVWIYWIGDLAGAAAAVAVWTLLLGKL